MAYEAGQGVQCSSTNFLANFKIWEESVEIFEQTSSKEDQRIRQPPSESKRSHTLLVIFGSVKLQVLLCSNYS